MKIWEKKEIASLNCLIVNWGQTKKQKLQQNSIITYTLDSKGIKDNMGRISVWLIFSFKDIIWPYCNLFLWK